MTEDFRFRRMVLMWLVATATLVAPVSLLAQGANIDAPHNKYSISDGLRLGREAAAQVEQRMPILPEGGDIDDYAVRVGQRLGNRASRTMLQSPELNAKEQSTRVRFLRLKQDSK